jgi:ParB family transcriptional regulator, chromosome partitioning protein
MAEEINKRNKPGGCVSECQSSERNTDRLRVPDRLLRHVEYGPIDELEGHRRNARRHPNKQLRKLEDGIGEFGFTAPILADGKGNILAGHARIMAAKRRRMTEVPVIRLHHLSPAQVRAFRIFDNRIADVGEWDWDELALEFQ